MSRILVFDSGVGGLTVLDAIRAVLPDASYVYVADNDGFPYGEWDEDDLIARTVALFDQLVATWSPDLCVIACNTASTLVLPHLRARFAMPFAGTVPAIKAAAKLTRSGLVSVLATPGTMKREYTRALIRTFATHVAVRLVGCHELAPIAEAKLAGRAVDMDAVRMEIAPAFLDTGGRRTDTVVLACTPYPLILDDLRAAAPWAVEWIDPAPAIARRVLEVLPPDAADRPAAEGAIAVFTAPQRVTRDLAAALQARGLNLRADRPVPA